MRTSKISVMYLMQVFPSYCTAMGVCGISTNRHDLVNNIRIFILLMTTGHVSVWSLSLSGFFFIHDISPCLCKEKHYRCHMWNRNCFPFMNTSAHPDFLWGSCCSIFSFLCSAFYITLCPIVFFFWQSYLVSCDI